MQKKCPHCAESEKIVNYGKYKNTQRFKCKNCKKIFLDKNYAIKNKKENDLAEALYNLLSIKPEGPKFRDLELSELLQNKKNDKKLSIKIKNIKGNTGLISCYNPKILLCQGINGDIEMVRLPDCFERECKLSII